MAQCRAIDPQPSAGDAARGSVHDSQQISADTSPVERVRDALELTESNSVFPFFHYPAQDVEGKWPNIPLQITSLWRSCVCAPSEPNKQQVLAYNVIEGWGHTNDATPEAC